MGCKTVYTLNGDPAVEGTVLKKPEDIRGLKKPDPYKDGLMPMVLKTIDYMKEATDLPISFTDPQGPLNIALCICGVENLFIWMYTAPDYVHEIMTFCTEVFIDWVKVQKEHIGQRIPVTAFPHGIVLPEDYGGIWIADDDCTVISDAQYKEFVVPYNSQVLKAFGGGTIHFCGTAEHQIQNFLETEGCNGINNFCMGNFEQIYKMQEAFEDKMALMVCDFAPLKVKKYYEELFEGLNKKGTIVACFPRHGYALDEGKYACVEREKEGLTAEIYQVLEDLSRRSTKNR